MGHQRFRISLERDGLPADGAARATPARIDSSVPSITFAAAGTATTPISFLQ